MLSLQEQADTMAFFGFVVGVTTKSLDFEPMIGVNADPCLLSQRRRGLDGRVLQYE